MFVINNVIGYLPKFNKLTVERLSFATCNIIAAKLLKETPQMIETLVNSV